ncbi:TPA: CRISPR-associated DxTHG motif protein [Escherichia coli]
MSIRKDTVRRHSLRYLKSDKRLFSPCTHGIRFITFKFTDVF